MPRGGKSGARIRWTPEEGMKLAKKIKQLRKDNPEWTGFEMLDAAQSVLPEDRQRNLFGWDDRGPNVTAALEQIGFDFSHISRSKSSGTLTVSQDQPVEPVAEKPKPKPERQRIVRPMQAALEKAKAKVEEAPPAPPPAPAPKQEPKVEYKAPPPAPVFDDAEVKRTQQRILQSFSEATAMPLMDAFFNLARSMAVQFGSEVAREVAVMVGKQATLAAREAIRTELAGLSEKVTKSIERPYDTLSQPVPPKAPEELAVKQAEPVQQVIIQATSSVPVDAHHVKMAPKDRKPKVAVIGLMRQQESEITREFEESIDFVWVRGAHNGGTGELLPDRIVGCDVIVGMRFVSPGNVSVAKKAGIPWAAVHGNFSALKRWLQQWYNGEIALAKPDESRAA
jgi:hypothetical protein